MTITAGEHGIWASLSHLRRAFWSAMVWPNRLVCVRQAKRMLYGRVTIALVRNARVEAEGESTGRQRSFVVVASCLGKQIGRVAVCPMWEHIGLEGSWLSGVWVHPALRGVGLGERLVARAEQEAARTGISAVMLNVDPDNGPAIALYRKLGYQVPEEGSYRLAIEAYNREVGNPVEQVVLRKRLVEP